MTYRAPERRLLDEVSQAVEADSERAYDVFLCHAWDDRKGAASDLCRELVALDVDVWFSERDVVLGKSLGRQLDAGLRLSRVGIVLMTPNMLEALRNGGYVDQELGALLANDRVIPISHGVDFEELRFESPLLGTRAGLSTSESSLGEVAAKIAESVLHTRLT